MRVTETVNIHYSRTNQMFTYNIFTKNNYVTVFDQLNGLAMLGHSVDGAQGSQLGTPSHLHK